MGLCGIDEVLVLVLLGHLPGIASLALGGLDVADGGAGEKVGEELGLGQEEFHAISPALTLAILCKRQTTL